MGKDFAPELSAAPTKEATRILQEWNRGDQNAFARLMPLVYEELRGAGGISTALSAPDHTLPTTALVHEAY